MLPFYRVDHIPKASRKRPGHKLDPKFITIHDTGNPRSTAANERAWLTNPQNKSVVGYHIVVDEKQAIECIPLDENAWHAGDGGKGTGNRQSIGIELCEPGDREKTLANAAKVVAELLKKYQLGITAVKQHNNWSGKNCPRLLRQGNKWELFLSQISIELVTEPELSLEANGKKIDLPLKIIDGRTYFLAETLDGEHWVQIRALAELLNAQIEWKGETRTVVLQM